MLSFRNSTLFLLLSFLRTSSFLSEFIFFLKFTVEHNKCEQMHISFLAFPKCNGLGHLVELQLILNDSFKTFFSILFSQTQRDGMEREVGGGSGWGAHVNPWLIHVNVWQKPLQYCTVISLQLIKINGKKNRKTLFFFFPSEYPRSPSSNLLSLLDLPASW